MFSNEQLEEFKKNYPEIASMTEAELIDSKEFKETYEKALRLYKPVGSAFHAIRSLNKDGLLNLDKFKGEYIRCLDKQSDLPFAKRSVILQIGNMAYAFAVKRMMKNYDDNKKNKENASTQS